MESKLKFRAFGKDYELNVEGREAGAHIIIVPDIRWFSKLFFPNVESNDYFIPDFFPIAGRHEIIRRQVKAVGGQLLCVTNCPRAAQESATLWSFQPERKESHGGELLPAKLVEIHNYKGLRTDQIMTDGHFVHYLYPNIADYLQYGI